MGIPGLNRFILQRTKGRSVQTISFRSLRGHRVAIDISMYLYRAIGGVGVSTGLYQIIGAMRRAGAEPVFVFDGKPPADKGEVLAKRRSTRVSAERRLEAIEAIGEPTPAECNLAAKLRKQTVRVRWEDRELAKAFVTAAGCDWWQANGEADSLCVALCQEGDVWACMTDDMDIVASGCPRVLRKASFLRGRCVLYDAARIAQDIGLPTSDWAAWAALAGCDYGGGDGVATAYDAMLGGGSPLSQKQERSKQLLETWQRGSQHLGSYHPRREVDYVQLAALLREEGLVFAPHCSIASIAPRKTVEDNIRVMSK